MMSFNVYGGKGEFIRDESPEDVQIFTGTLIGPHGQMVGRFVRQQDYHNLAEELLQMREKLRSTTST